VRGQDLALMQRIDELHLEYPFARASMLMRMFRRDGVAVGRKHVARCAKNGIEAPNSKPKYSRKNCCSQDLALLDT